MGRERVLQGEGDYTKLTGQKRDYADRGLTWMTEGAEGLPRYKRGLKCREGT